MLLINIYKLIKKEECAYNPDNKADVVVTEAKRLKTGQDKDLATAIYNYGPVAIAVHVTKDMASYKYFTFYITIIYENYNFKLFRVCIESLFLRKFFKGLAFSMIRTVTQER